MTEVSKLYRNTIFYHSKMCLATATNNFKWVIMTCIYLYLGYAQIYWVLNGTLNLLFLARFCKTLFLPEILSNQILTQHSQSSQEGCYDFSKSSYMFFRIFDHYTLEWQKAISAYL